MSHLPVVCTLTPAALRIRREDLLKELVGRAEQHESIPDGLRFKFAAVDEMLVAIARVVSALLES